MVVPDLLRDGLRLVFCGTALGRASMEARAYYAHPGNRFWRTLFETGIIPEPLKHADYPRLLDFGIGLTDLNKTEWGADSELTPGGFDVPAFHEKMRRYRPGMIAFTSKKAGSLALGVRRVAYGLQPGLLEGAGVFVLPSPSGLACKYFDKDVWRALADRVLKSIR
jgi:double-stranded uracil-DNA glycosylase